MIFWTDAIDSAPPTLDVMLDGAAAMCGDTCPELRDRYRREAVEARADSFLRTLAEIRDA